MTECEAPGVVQEAITAYLAENAYAGRAVPVLEWATYGAGFAAGRASALLEMLANDETPDP